jgi:hypothetical protein
MPRKYRVYIREKQFGWIEVESESQEGATEKAMREMEQGKVEWCDVDTEVDEVIELDPETQFEIRQ